MAAKKGPGKELTTWRERAKADVVKHREKVDAMPDASGGSFISWADASIAVGPNEVNPLDCVILAFQYERAWYEKAFTPGSKETPTCFSFDGVRPHAESSEKQCGSCDECEWNQYGSANQGKGKACGEGAKVALLTLDDIEGPVWVSKKFSWTSYSKSFRPYIDALLAAGDAVWSVATQIKNKPNKTSQYLLSFVKGELPKNDAMMELIVSKVEAAEKALLQPYPKKEAEVAPPPASGRKRKFAA